MQEETKSKEEKNSEQDKQAQEAEIEEKTKEEEKEEEKTKPEEPRFLEEPIKVKDLILINMLSFETKAWAYMDLVVHPETQKHKKDINEARLAIDTIESLYKIVEVQLDEREKKDIQVRLTNLHLNFVKKD